MRRESKGDPLAIMYRGFKHEGQPQTTRKYLWAETDAVALLNNSDCVVLMSMEANFRDIMAQLTMVLAELPEDPVP